MLDAAQIETFRRDGVLILRGLIQPEQIAEWRDAGRIRDREGALYREPLPFQEGLFLRTSMPFNGVF
jgi:hypothetical protein